MVSPDRPDSVPPCQLSIGRKLAWNIAAAKEHSGRVERLTFPRARLQATREQFRRASGLAPSRSVEASRVAPCRTSSAFTSSCGERRDCVQRTRARAVTSLEAEGIVCSAVNVTVWTGGAFSSITHSRPGEGGQKEKLPRFLTSFSQRRRETTARTKLETRAWVLSVPYFQPRG